jgi:hypothetical protein
MELEAYRSVDDPSGAIEAGERALQFAPGNLQVTAELASIIADTKADPQQLAHADSNFGIVAGSIAREAESARFRRLW